MVWKRNQRLWRKALTGKQGPGPTTSHSVVEWFIYRTVCHSLILQSGQLLLRLSVDSLHLPQLTVLGCHLLPQGSKVTLQQGLLRLERLAGPLKGAHSCVKLWRGRWQSPCGITGPYTLQGGGWVTLFESHPITCYYHNCWTLSRSPWTNIILDGSNETYRQLLKRRDYKLEINFAWQFNHSRPLLQSCAWSHTCDFSTIFMYTQELMSSKAAKDV